MADNDWIFALDDALAAIPKGSNVGYGLRHGTMRIGVYTPRGIDDQAPHEQDELYIVVSGNGFFVKNGERRPFKPQDAIFVEAHAEHHFEDFSDDFATWMIFWGRKGGEE